MIIEETTTYAYKLKYIENLNFDRIRTFAQSFVSELPQELVDDIYDDLNRGVDQLTTEPQMLVYLYSFGKMHQAKLNRAFEQLPDAFLQQPEIRIVDYGCGQAIGTMCYADYLAEHGLSQNIKSVTLIEPSEICLKRATLHVSQFFPDAEMHTVCKTFNDLTDDDLANPDDIPTLHILSNVLDIQEFDLEQFVALIDNNLSNYNQFICVGPYFNYSDKDERMTRFTELLNGNVSYSKIFKKGKLSADKTWTAQIVCFSVGELEEELSTKVTENDLSGVRDDDYCLYSLNRKRMISYGRTYDYEYEIDPNTIVICDECFFDVYNEIDYNYLSILHIPKSVKFIGKNPFCRSIENIICDSPHFIVENGFLLTKDKNKIVFYLGKEKSISIPKGITCIGSGSFCSLDFSSIVIPSSVIEIEYNPFVDAHNMVDNYFLPFEIISESSRFSFFDNLLFDNVEKRVISYCGKETEFEIPNGTKVIGKNAFFGAEFEKVNFPNSIEYVDETAFYWCFNLKTILIPIGSNEKFKEILPKNLWNKLTLPTKTTYKEIESGIKDEFGVIYSKDGKRLLKSQNEHLEKYKIKEGTNVICNESFGYRAFYSNFSLQSITIPNTITCIGDYAFDSCKKLKQIFIPNSVISIGESAFSFCESLLQIQISNSVKSIGEYAFSYCESLLQINIPNSITKLYARTFSSCEQLQHIIIPDSVTHIDNYVFENCRSLHQIIIPKSVKSIGLGAFAYCSALQQIYISDSDINIARNALIDCGSLQQIIIPEGTTEKFKKMLPEELWDKLYCLKKAE